MDNIVQLAMQIVFCLLIAALLGAIIGYLLGKMSKCGKDDYDDYDEFSEKKLLNDYSTTDEITYLDEGRAQGVSKNKSISTTSSVAANLYENSQNSISKINEKVVGAVKEDSSFVTGTGQEVGIRPHAVEKPQDHDIEDLKEISGIGIKIEEVLHSLGIYYFHQIAEWTPENIEWIENYLTLKGRIKKEDWVNQAKLLSVGTQNDFSKKIIRGRNSNN